MTTLSLPLNAKLVAEPANAPALPTTPTAGIIPAIFEIPVSLGDIVVEGQSGTYVDKFIIPAGYQIFDVRYFGTALWTGTSIGKTELAIGKGTTDASTKICYIQQVNAQTTYITNLNAVTFHTGLVGEVLANPVTISFGISVSGSAAMGVSTGSLTSGAGKIQLTLGIPFNLATRD